VRRRTREIGIRRTLGAGSREVLDALFRPASRSLGIGVLAGLLLTFCAGLVMRYYSLPQGVDPFDLATYALVAGATVIAGLIATWHPSRRAVRVEPAVALRYE